MSRLRTANLLAALAREITTRAEDVLKSHHNQTDSATAALNTLSYWDGITNAELAKTLELSHAATVRLVDKLEAQGLVRASTGPDLRATYLHLTEAGERQVRPALAARCAVVDRYLDSLSRQEEKQLADLLEKLIRPLATDDYAVGHFCRLCDFTSCPDENCPMHAPR